MIWLYRLLFLPVLLLASPYYLYRMLRRGGYAKDFAHRFGWIPCSPARPPETRRIWVQAVSVGEVQALQPLLAAWQRQPEIQVVLTTTTSTGYSLAQARYAENLHRVGIFPIDFLPFSRQAWKRIAPDLVILMEGELWPEHLHQARQRGIPAVLINARLSDRSFRRYLRWPAPGNLVFSRLTHILAATDLDRDRFRKLVADSVPIETTGSLKVDVAIEPVLSPAQRQELRRDLGFPDGAVVLLGSSTWPGEEAFLLEVRDQAESLDIDCRLLLVPRHAERRGEILALLKNQPASWVQRSASPGPVADARIYLGDTTGEMRRLAQAADLAFIGKSLPPHTQGQTPIEAAALGIPLVTGPGMSNFRQITDDLNRSDGCLRGDSRESVRELLIDCIQNPEKRQALGNQARQWHRNNRGAAEKTLKILQTYL